MTDRRQEAIEMLRDIRREMEKSQVPWKLGEWAEYVYDRLAALREFPEELEDMLGELYDATLDDYATRQWVKHWINKFKRLWQGQDYPFNTLVDRNAEHKNAVAARGLALVQKKGGCPTCRGSEGKQLPLSDISQHVYTDHLPCPDCKGTGERRKGEQRKDTGKRDYDRANHTKDIDGCAPQYETLKGKILDRRINEERRK